MIYIMLLLTLFPFVLLIKNFRNYLTWIFMLLIIGLDMAIFALLVYLAKVGNYQIAPFGLFRYDYMIFLYLSEIKITYYSIFKLMNIGIDLFVLMFPILALTLFNKDKITFKTIALWSTLLILPLFYIWFYLPSTGYMLYVSSYSLQNKAWLHVFRFVITVVDNLNLVWVLAYLLFPIYVFYKYYRKSTVQFARKQILSLMVVLLLLDTMFLIFFIAGPMFNIDMYSADLNLLRTPIQVDLPYYYYISVSVSILILLEVMLYILLRNSVMDVAHFLTTKKISRNIRDLNKNLRGVLHSFKNTLFTVKILVDQLEEYPSGEKSRETVHKLKNISEHSLNHLTRMMNSLKEIRLQPVKASVADGVKLALEKTYIDENIQVDLSQMSYNVYAYYDMYHLTEVISNLLQNAVESIKEVRRSQGIIKIEVKKEYMWVIIRIVDNGKGIGKRERKKIFNPMYSSRTAKTNWGIGLSYSYRVVKAHLGFIHVESKEGVGTAFEILLHVGGKERGMMIDE